MLDFVILVIYSITDILRIENLWQFTSLVKLQLDNNIIEKIEGLDTLKNLIWLGKLWFSHLNLSNEMYDKKLFKLLDLSFNNIEKIEGLDNLTKLTDLSLYNNRITKLENMDVLEKLEVFSIGNNLLNNFDNVCNSI